MTHLFKPSVMSEFDGGAAPEISDKPSVVPSRWSVLAALISLLVGFCAGVSLGARRTVVVDFGAVAKPLAPSMSLNRFLACSEVQPEPDLDTLALQWALHYWRPDWPAP